MRKKLLRLLSLVLTGTAAVVWTVNAVILAVYTRHDPPPEFLLPLNILCAVLFWAAFLTRLWLLLRRRGENPEEKKSPARVGSGDFLCL